MVSGEMLGFISFSPTYRAILNGVFTKPQKIDPPHIEDSYFSSLKTVGSVSSTEFQAILDRSSFISIQAGFELTSKPINKFLPSPPCKSIITLKLQPKDLHIAHDQYDINKIKAHLTDADGLTMSFIPIKDLGFCDNVGQEATRKKTAQEMTEYLHTQDMLYVRLGVGRKFKSKDGRDGFWMQVNGIYSFQTMNISCEPINGKVIHNWFYGKKKLQISLICL